MARPNKINARAIQALRDAYEKGMSTTEIATRSKDLLGVQISSATVYNYLRRLNAHIRNKSDSLVLVKGKKPLIKLTSITGKRKSTHRWNTRYWNARWLLAIGTVKAENSMLTVGQAELLRKLLDEFGDRNALPEKMVDDAFAWARREGFPYLVMDEREQVKAWARLLAAKPVKKDGAYHWVGAETTLATMFHPHIYECRKKGKMSPLELFQSDTDLKRAIRKALCLHGKINKRLLNDICRNEDASGRVGNFPPRVGKAVIQELYGDKQGITVLDPCAGFGGRMFACAAMGTVKRYLGIDLSQKTYAGLVDSRNFLNKMKCNMEIDLRHTDCIKVLDSIAEEFDLVLTSPPFFDVEEYVGVDLPKQYDSWMNNFLRPMMEGCFRRLRQGGKMALYIGKARHHPIPDECTKMASKMGFISHDTIGFRMNFGNSSRIGQERGIGILVWEKP